MPFLPNLFLANMRAKGGPSKQCRYEVVLPIPAYVNNFISNGIIETILNLPNSVFYDVSNAINSVLSSVGLGSDQMISSNVAITRYLALQCENAELPGKNILTQDVKIYGPRFKVPYAIDYDPISLTFICSNDFQERKLFDRWIECICPTDTNNFRYQKEESTSYLTNLKIIQFDDFVRQIYAVELVDAFPIRIASQQLSWGSNDFHRLSVQFAYHKYKTIYSGNYDIGSIATSLIGSQVASLIPGSIT